MHAVGVDIGGTKIAAGLVTDDGHIVRRTRRDTTPEDPTSIELAVIDAVSELIVDQHVESLGVAAAGFVDPTRSSVLFAPNIAWRDYPLRDRLAAHIDLPIVIENDANAAGWAEFRFGAGRGVHDMVMLTIGTGLGGALIVDGRLLRGAHGVAAEIGHMRIVPSGHLCGCGHRGCWEQYASGSALVRDARVAVREHPEAGARLLAAAGGDVEALIGPQITVAAADGDKLAIELLAELGRWIGEGIASLVDVMDPELVVIGGGVCAAGDLLLAPAREAFLSQLSARGHRAEPHLALADIGNDAGIVGAAELSRI